MTIGSLKSMEILDFGQKAPVQSLVLFVVLSQLQRNRGFRHLVAQVERMGHIDIV